MRAPNHPYVVRPATSKDVSRLCEFAGDFLAKMHAGVSGKDAQQVFERAVQNSDTCIVLVAEHKAGICAYAYAGYQWRSEFGGQTMDLIELFVEEAWRKKGVAGSLIGGLIENAQQRGIHRISAEVHPGNAAIERMLDSVGFDPEHRTVWGLTV